MKNPTVTIFMKTGKSIKIELYPNNAPNTVNNFLSLAKNGFYNGLIFHRVIENFMIQGGDPEGSGMGGPGYRIKGEFTSNNHNNELKHRSGVISMARSQHPDSAGSQFFIVHKDALHLDGLYACFGEVVSGFDEVDRIARIKTDSRDKPLEDEVIKEVSIELNDYDFIEPIKILSKDKFN